MNAKGSVTDLPGTIRSLHAGQKLQLVESLCSVINQQRQNLLQQILAQRTRYLTVVLEDIYQPQNASAVIRSAECFGLQELHIIENKNEYQLNPGVVQGASKWIELQRYKENNRDNTETCLNNLRDRGYRIIAMTLRESGQDLEQLSVDSKLALCFGSEEPGLSDVAHDMADEFVSIPMCGFTRSLNLSVSAGISLYHLTGQLRKSSVSWQLSEEDRMDLYIDWLSKSTPAGKVLLEKFLCSVDQVN